jgi:hypothetical protein
MMVTWVTQNATGPPMVEYGPDVGNSNKKIQNSKSNTLRWPKFDQIAVGLTDKFVDGGKLKRILYIHRTKMTGLKPNQTYGVFFSSKYVFFCLNFLNLKNLFIAKVSC